ncbi:MAG: Uma2 family endonuclease [Deltaproteobacteria bacterium]|nr:Uma2 family endonuclease [Deltaproteobacteria bacterium]
MAVPALKLSTWGDLDALGPDARSELIDGVIVEKAAGEGEHGTVQSGVNGLLFPSFSRRGGGGQPGGWWFQTETDIAFGDLLRLRPDIAGWRRERVPENPRGFPVREIPDWVCEVLSTSTAHRDLGRKREVYHAAKVGHYWLVDPQARVLTVLRWAPDGYLVAQAAGQAEAIRAEPFEAVRLFVGVLFGADPDDAPPESTP